MDVLKSTFKSWDSSTTTCLPQSQSWSDQEYNRDAWLPQHCSPSSLWQSSTSHLAQLSKCSLTEFQYEMKRCWSSLSKPPATGPDCLQLHLYETWIYHQLHEDSFINHHQLRQIREDNEVNLEKQPWKLWTTFHILEVMFPPMLTLMTRSNIILNVLEQLLDVCGGVSWSWHINRHQNVTVQNSGDPNILIILKTY